MHAAGQADRSGGGGGGSWRLPPDETLQVADPKTKEDVSVLLYCIIPTYIGIGLAIIPTPYQTTHATFCIHNYVTPSDRENCKQSLVSRELIYYSTYNKNT